MSGQGQWISITSLQGPALEDFITLAEFGEHRVRAARILGYDYDPAALVEDSKRQQASLDEIEKRGDPLALALASSRPPSRSHLPIVKVAMSDHEFPSEVIAVMPPDDGVWETGNLKRVDLADPRRHFQYRGICYWRDSVDGSTEERKSDKFTFAGARALGLKGDFLEDDFPIILKMHDRRRQDAALSIRAAAGEFGSAAKGVNTQRDSRIDRLRTLYSRWEKLGE